MRLFRISLPVIVLLCSCLNAVATEEIDEFGDEQATFVRWNDCQAYRDRLKFGNEGRTHLAAQPRRRPRRQRRPVQGRCGRRRRRAARTEPGGAGRGGGNGGNFARRGMR